MYVATCIMALGYTRTNGIIAYNQSDKSFPLLTPARARKMIDAGELKGVLWTKNPDSEQLEFVPDKEGWNLGNIMVLSGLTYRPWHETVGETIQNSIYSVVRIFEDNDRTLYEVVSNTFQRISLNAVQLIELSNITDIGGVIIDNEDIRALDGVIVEKKQPAVVEQAETEKPEKKPRVSRHATSDSGSKTAGTKRKPSTKKK